MTYGKLTDNRFLLRFEKGEEILSALTAFCLKQNIKNAEVSAIGSVEQATLAHYRVDRKKYTEKHLDGIFEVLTLLGTVALVDKAPIPHLHATLSNEDMHAFGGHLVKAIVSATLEMTITVFPTEFEKLPNEEIGLKLYTLPVKGKA